MKKLSFLLIAFILSGFLQAQDASTINFTFNHLALSVKDVERSAEFYKNVLNLQEITNRTKIEGIRWFSFGDGKELHLISILSERVTINKAVHFALTTSNFDALIKSLTEMNITYSDWPGTPNTINIRADGIKQIFFQDPDGYWIEVNNVAQK
jgi:lactoylglutathione lyase